MSDRRRGGRSGADGTAEPFRWIVGIENAFIPDMQVDELSWTGHRSRWREDLALAAEVGADALRYGITWPEVEREPGVYEWKAVDDAFDELARLGIEPIWDLVHFGVPAYLTGGYLDGRFVSAYAAYAEAFAKRYRGTVAKLTPWNEPYISTYFRAGWGIWPPHLKGAEGFAQVLRPVVSALREGIRLVERVAPEMEIWLNDGADTFHPKDQDDPRLVEEAAFLTLQRYAAFDLLLGQAAAGQETYEWLAAAGYPPHELGAEPVRVDVIGLDYYPETEHDLSFAASGEPVVEVARRPLGLAATCEQYWQRYRRPLFVAESSASGSDEARRTWLEWNLAEIDRARGSGIDVRGYTWWPLFDHIDWDSLLQRRAGNVCPAGLYHLSPTVADRTPTAAVEDFRRAARGRRPLVTP